MAEQQMPEMGQPVQILASNEYARSGVYFLYHKGLVVYVGQSKTLRWRIESHLASAVKAFDAVAYLRCTTDRLMEIESHYIGKLVPKYNDCRIARAIRHHTPWKLPKHLTPKVRKPRWTAAQRATAS